MSLYSLQASETLHHSQLALGATYTDLSEVVFLMQTDLAVVKTDLAEAAAAVLLFCVRSYGKDRTAEGNADDGH